MKLRNRTAFFAGRFQPLHMGHMHALRELFKEYPKVIIAIGSINRSGPDNPFTFGERKQMLDAALKKYKGRYRIIGLRDRGSNEEWASNAIKTARFDVVVTGNSIVRECFLPLNIEIREPDFFHPEKYNGTKIRGLIFKVGKWRHLVPEEVSEIIRIKHKSLPLSK
ncbi:MAG: nicotinamide-nucleotide adenylyltransferase [Candidatus Aenigmarchaeota archaeon]|nr:nicotinamide-nucleotide adenylyltransferase [Candidatus Aenigmarchaeota archaeon]